MSEWPHMQTPTDPAPDPGTPERRRWIAYHDTVCDWDCRLDFGTYPQPPKGWLPTEESPHA